jgi:hypothetical protein
MPEENPMVIVDRDFLSQVVLNLLGNAIKFTDEGTVTLFLGFEKGKDDQAFLIMEVRDTGKGVSEKELKDLFNPYVQAEEGRKRGIQGGSGLGLSLVKKFLDLMGGKITVTSTVGKGTTFNVRVPVRVVEEPKKQANAPVSTQELPKIHADINTPMPQNKSDGVANRSELRTAAEITDRILSAVFSASPAYATETEPQLFPERFRTAQVVPEAFNRWPVFNKIVTWVFDVFTERMVIDQRHGVPDAISVLPLVAFARYNPKADTVLALIADDTAVNGFIKKITALSPEGKLPQNFKVRGFASENEFVLEFAEFYNSSVPFGRSVALVTDRADSVVTHKIGVRKKLLSVVGDADPLKQTASSLLAAAKLLDDSVWSMSYHFVAAGELGGFDALMAELAGYLAAQKTMAAAA